MKFTEENLLLWPHRDSYLLELLNGEYTIEAAREDLESLVNSNYNNDGDVS
jgi:hypothetical protein